MTLRNVTAAESSQHKLHHDNLYVGCRSVTTKRGAPEAKEKRTLVLKRFIVSY